MTPEAILKAHERACERLHACLLSENGAIKRFSEFPPQELLKEKQEATKALQATLQLLKQIPAIEEMLRPCSEACHGKLMKIIYLSRENEQLLLGLTRPPRSDATPKPASNAQLRRAYGN
jgi:hypothetical protein